VFATQSTFAVVRLCLLLFYRVDEEGGELIVSDAFDLAFVVAKGEQRLDLFNCELKTGDCK
jgi:hypothetical protein